MMSLKDLACRACMQTCAETENPQEVDFLNLKPVYTELTLLHVSDDDPLPKYLCSKCSELLGQFKSFKDTCIESDLRLRKSLVNIKEEMVVFSSEMKVEPFFVSENDNETITDDDETQRKRKFKPETNSSDIDDNEDSEDRPIKGQGKRKVKEETASSDEDYEKKRPSKKHGKKTDYKCKYCQKMFTKEKSYLRHVQRHEKHDQPWVSTKYEHVCLICDKRFQLEKSLQNHCKEAHTALTTEDNMFTCEECGTKCKTKDGMKKHLDSHFGAPPEKESYKLDFKCPYEGCRSLFKLKERLDIHVRCHEAGIPLNVCDICFKPMASARGMQRHRREKHEKQTYQCKLCYKVLTNHASFLGHVKRHETAPTCDVICDVCGLAFQNNSIMKAHKQSHSEERNFKCDQCSVAFKTYGILCSHRAKVHAKQESDCLICGQRFRSKETLYRHCKVDHTVYTTTENLIFTCKICEGKFKTQMTLKNHEKLHTGERKYACTLCPQTFAHSVSLKRHGYTHTGERPFTCEFCGKGFTKTCALKTHKKSHTQAMMDTAGFSGNFTPTVYL